MSSSTVFQVVKIFIGEGTLLHWQKDHFSYILSANSKIKYGIHPYHLATTFVLMNLRLIVQNCHVYVLWHSMKVPLITLPLSFKQPAVTTTNKKGCNRRT